MTQEHYAYILINDEKWWNRRIGQNKTGKSVHAFVRRGRVGPKGAHLLLFYVKHPVREIRGFGEFVERITGDTDELWNTYGHETVFESINEYKNFVEGRTKVTFIRFKNLQELSNPIHFKAFSSIIDVARMPRSGKYISRETTNQLILKAVKD